VTIQDEEGSRAPIAPPPIRFNDIVVAVHGIGQQIRYSTVRSVATRLAASRTLRTGSKYPPVAPQPLGYFHSEVKGLTSVVLVDDLKALQPALLSGVGFAEVFWADIPDKVLKEGSTLEETKAWARTVVARAQAIWARRRDADAITPAFSLAAEVLDEIIETIYVLENLLFLADKAGLFKFDLREVLEAYLGDVQIVAEFANYRRDIVLRFHQAMQNIYEEQRIGNENVRLHIVAHSEGTVVSFLGLLQAMSGVRLKQSGPPDAPVIELERTGSIPNWLKHVHGYMTIGSPIDKHLLLWPRMWNGLNPSLADKDLAPRQIKWRNYYDYGDPIGFKLDTARERLKTWQSNAFEFGDEHDYGFARYLLAGKAHNDYWNDPDVFEHFVRDVVIAQPADTKPPQPPKTRPFIYVLSPALPYVLSFCLLVAGVYVLDKAVLNFTYPFADPLVRYLLISEIGVEPAAAMGRKQALLDTLGIAALIAGATLLARFPRLAGGARWLGAGFLGFAAGCAIYARAVSEASREEIGGIFVSSAWGKAIGGIFHSWETHGPTIGICLLALVVGGIGLLAARRSKDPDEDRRQRWVLRGTRPLMLCGAFAVALIVASQLFPGRFGLQAKLTTGQGELLTKLTTKEQVKIVESFGFDEKELEQLFEANNLKNLPNLPKVKPLLTARPPVWPVLLAGALFLYLWWLATLVFDLAFVWQRYVRGSVANDRLREWAAGESHDKT
jgi:hypothetical protein